MKEYTIPAELGELERVKSYLEDLLKGTPSSEEEKMAIEVSAEEIFVNIVKYAKISKNSPIELRYDYREEEQIVMLQFRDEGVCFDPLQSEEPRIQEELTGREPGGLGIYMVKNMMDEVRYEYCGGKNVLTLEKRLSKQREEDVKWS